MSDSGGKYADHTWVGLKEELSAIRGALRKSEQEHRQQKRVRDEDSRYTYNHIMKLHADERAVLAEMDYREREKERRRKERDERERQKEADRQAREEEKKHQPEQRQQPASRPGPLSPPLHPSCRSQLESADQALRSWLKAVGHEGVPSPSVKINFTWTMRGRQYYGWYNSETNRLTVFMQVWAETAETVFYDNNYWMPIADTSALIRGLQVPRAAPAG